MAWEFESPPGHQLERTSFDSNAEALFLREPNGGRAANPVRSERKQRYPKKYLPFFSLKIPHKKVSSNCASGPLTMNRKCVIMVTAHQC